jgi:hypothetical protein
VEYEISSLWIADVESCTFFQALYAILLFHKIDQTAVLIRNHQDNPSVHCIRQWKLYDGSILHNNLNLYLIKYVIGHRVFVRLNKETYIKLAFIHKYKIFDGRCTRKFLEYVKKEILA